MKKLILSLLAIASILAVTLPCYPAAEWSVTDPLGSRNVSDIDYYIGNNNAALDRVLSNYRKGMALVYDSTSQIIVGAVEVVCSNSDASVQKMRKNTAATTVTWADIDTGAEAGSTTYYIYANCTADATTATFKISADATNPEATTTSYKRLGSFYNNANSDITTITDDAMLSQFGTFESKSDSVTYKASINGLVVGYTTLSSTNATMVAYSDTVAAPTTVVQSASGTWVSGSPGVQHPICFPVRKGNYYKVVSSAGSTLFFVPLGN